MLDQIYQTYRAVWRLRAPLLRLTFLWFVFAVVGKVISGDHNFVVGQTTLSWQGYVGALVQLFSILAAWYCAHRYMLDPTAKVDFLPSPLQLRFIRTQVMNLLLVCVGAALLMTPLVVWLALTYSLAPPEVQQGWINRLSYGALPFVVLLFGRLILMAPLLVRDAVGTARSSWRLTRGHTLRLFMLQLAVLAPMVLAGGVGMVAPINHWAVSFLIDFIGIAGAFVSLLLLTQLAEDEYKRLNCG